MVTHNIRVTFRLTKTGINGLKKKAKDANLTVSDYLRKCIDQEVLFLDQNLKNFIKLIKELDAKRFAILINALNKGEQNGDML